VFPLSTRAHRLSINDQFFTHQQYMAALHARDGEVAHAQGAVVGGAHFLRAQGAAASVVAPVSVNAIPDNAQQYSGSFPPPVSINEQFFAYPQGTAAGELVLPPHSTASPPPNYAQNVRTQNNFIIQPGATFHSNNNDDSAEMKQVLGELKDNITNAFDEMKICIADGLGKNTKERKEHVVDPVAAAQAPVTVQQVNNAGGVDAVVATHVVTDGDHTRKNVQEVRDGRLVGKFSP